MSMNHEEVYRLAKRDVAFNAAQEASGERMPRMTFDTLEKGLWSAAYSGWVLGTFGPAEHMRRAAEWRQL